MFAATTVHRNFLRCALRARNMSSSNVDNLSSYIRSAHCTEIFRSTYYKASKAIITITPGDLDDIIVSEKVRPSVLLGCFENFGSALGTVARFAPTHISSVLTKVVDDAAQQQFNDSIREISAMGSESHDDVKETIKYHRDLTPNTPLDTAATSFNETAFVLSTGLSNILNFTRSI